MNTIRSSEFKAMIAKRGDLTMIEVNGKVFAIGGHVYKSMLNSVESTTLADAKWTSLASMKYAREKTAAAVLDSYIYVTGGHKPPNILDLVEKYDIANNKWEVVAPLVRKRNNHGLINLNGALLAFGGWADSKWECSIETYKPELNSWAVEQLRMPECKESFAWIAM